MPRQPPNPAALERAWSCGLYRPGHDVHWIQSLRSGNDTEHRPEPGVLLDVSPDGVVRVQVGGEVRVLWHHDPRRLSWLVSPGSRVAHQPRWGLLKVMDPSPTYCFCVVDADSGAIRPCPPDPPRGNPLELMEKAGGFSLSLDEVDRGLDDEERPDSPSRDSNPRDHAVP